MTTVDRAWDCLQWRNAMSSAELQEGEHWGHIRRQDGTGSPRQLNCVA